MEYLNEIGIAIGLMMLLVLLINLTLGPALLVRRRVYEAIWLVLMTIMFLIMQTMTYALVLIIAALSTLGGV